METYLRQVTKTTQLELREALLCREGFRCPFLIQHQRWTLPQRLPSLRSPSIPLLLQRPIYQRPTMNHAKRSMPKKLGRARNPHLHYSSNQFCKAADPQVPTRSIRDCGLVVMESFSCFLCVVLLTFITEKQHTVSLGSIKRCHLQYRVSS